MHEAKETMRVAKKTMQEADDVRERAYALINRVMEEMGGEGEEEMEEMEEGMEGMEGMEEMAPAMAIRQIKSEEEPLMPLTESMVRL